MLTVLHDVYALAGRPSYRDMAKGIRDDDRAPATLNYQAVGKILKGKKIPSPRELLSLTSWLFREGATPGQGAENEQEVITQLLELREEAHRRSLGIPVTSEALTTDQSSETTDVSSLFSEAFIVERKMLSCMLRSKDAIADVVELLGPEASIFTNALHVEICTALLQLYSDNSDITVASVTRFIEVQNPTLTDVRSNIESLWLEAGNPRDAELHAERVINLAKLRQISSMGKKFTEIARDAAASSESPDLDSLVTAVENEVISFMYQITKISTVGSSLGDALDEVEVAGSTSGVAVAVPSGFPAFDSLNSGFRPGELVVVAGASGLGKSTLGLDFVRACSISRGLPSYLVTLQMDRNEMTMRMMAAEARVSLDRMRTGNMQEDDWTRLARIMPSVHEAPIWMQDEVTFTLTDLMRTSRRLSYFNDLRLMLIDSLDLLYVERENVAPDPERDLGILGRELRNLAKELRIPIVALLHIDQPSMNHSGYRKPALRDIPGSLEKFADVVVLLYREDAYEDESLRAGEADLIVTKNRSGPIATVTVAFQGHYARFVDMRR